MEETRTSRPGELGFPTYIAVRRDRHSHGVGAALFGAYEEMAREAGLDHLELVTRPGKVGAGPFFVKLGYSYVGERASRSGEQYTLYAKSFDDGASPELRKLG